MRDFVIDEEFDEVYLDRVIAALCMNVGMKVMNSREKPDQDGLGLNGGSQLFFYIKKMQGFPGDGINSSFSKSRTFG